MEIDPQGSSRSRGGIFRAKASGNVYNLADRHDDVDVEMLPISGSVYYYISGANPSTLANISVMNPSGCFQHTKVGTIGPVLLRLARLYPAVKTISGILVH